VATSIDGIALRNGLPLNVISLTCLKRLSDSPRRIAGLVLHVRVEHAVPDEMMLQLRRAAENCAVKRSLDPTVHVQVEFESVPTSGIQSSC
jgi:hypothetical protein